MEVPYVLLKLNQPILLNHLNHSIAQQGAEKKQIFMETTVILNQVKKIESLQSVATVDDFQLLVKTCN